LIDIMATCVDLGEANYPDQRNGNMIHPMQGQSLKPLLTGEGEFGDRTLYWEHEGNAAIRVGDRKLVRQGIRGPWELFDLKADRTEQNDLAGENPREVDALKGDWQRWARSVHAIPKPAPKGKKTKKE
jgi:arylsulfatase